MEAIAAKDFVEKLNAGAFKPSAHILGKVKKSENKNEVQFAFKAPELKWMNIPVSMIDHVHVLKSFKIGDEDVSLVKMKLKEPSDKEAKVFYDLLAGMGKHMESFWMKKMMWGGKHEEGMGEHFHKCGCGHWHHE